MRSAPTADRILPAKWSSRALLGRGPLVLSFDIFGFALEPAVLEAEDVHRLVASHLRDELGHLDRHGYCYASIRRLAEERARAAADRDGSGSVIGMPAVREQLGDLLIPTAMGGGDRAARAAIRREIRLHKELWRSNPAAHDLYRDAVAAGITVAFLADSPLPRDLVTSILRNAGYSQGLVLVSSQEGATKASGELFQTLRDRTGVVPDRITHLGPDRNTDVDRAVEAGMQARPAASRRTAALDKIVAGLVDRSGVDAVVLALAADRVAGTGADVKPRDVGYYAAGPLATGFAAWVARVIAATEPDHVLFCGPSGPLVQQVTAIVRPELAATSAHEVRGRDEGQPAMTTVAQLVRDLDLRDGDRLLAVDLGWGEQPHRWLADGAAGCGVELDIAAAYLGVTTAPDENDPVGVWALTGSSECPLTAATGDRMVDLSALLSAPPGDLAAGVVDFANDAARWFADLPDDATRALAEPALRLLDSPTAEEATLLGADAGRWPSPQPVPGDGQPISRWRRRPPARLRSRPPG